jgi:hypothetical protein
MAMTVIRRFEVLVYIQCALHKFNRLISIVEQQPDPNRLLSVYILYTIYRDPSIQDPRSENFEC